MRIPSSEFESMLASMPDQGILQISQNPKYMDDPNKAYLVESEKKHRVDTKEGQMAAMAQPPTIAQQNTQRLAGLQMPLDPSTITPDMARGINLAAGGGLIPLAEGGTPTYEREDYVPFSEQSMFQQLGGFLTGDDAALLSDIGYGAKDYGSRLVENPIGTVGHTIGLGATLAPVGAPAYMGGKALFKSAAALRDPATRQAALQAIKKGGEKLGEGKLGEFTRTLFTKPQYSRKQIKEFDKKIKGRSDEEIGKLWFNKKPEKEIKKLERLLKNPKVKKERKAEIQAELNRQKDGDVLRSILKDRGFPEKRGPGMGNKMAGEAVRKQIGARQFSPFRTSLTGAGGAKGLEYLMRDAEAQLPKEGYGKLTPFKPVPEGVKGQGQRSGRVPLEALTGTTPEGTPEGGGTPKKGLSGLLGNPELGQTLLETGLGMLGDTEVRGGVLGSLGRNATKAIKSAEQRKQAKADRKYKADLLGIKEKELELQESLLDIKADQARKALNLSSKDYLSLKQKYMDSAGMQERAKERALNILIPLTNPGFIDTMFGNPATEDDIDPKLLEGEEKRQMELIFAEDVIMGTSPQVSSAMQIAPDLGTGVGLQNPFAGFSSSLEN